MALAAIGFLGDALGIIGFAMDKIPNGGTEVGTVRLGIGKDGFEGLTNAGGNLLYVLTYDITGQELGIN